MKTHMLLVPSVVCRPGESTTISISPVLTCSLSGIAVNPHLGELDSKIDLTEVRIGNAPVFGLVGSLALLRSTFARTERPFLIALEPTDRPLIRLGQLLLLCITNNAGMSIDIGDCIALQVCRAAENA